MLPPFWPSVVGRYEICTYLFSLLGTPARRQRALDWPGWILSYSPMGFSNFSLSQTQSAGIVLEGE